MFGLGMGEIVVILVLALILLGPQKLPEAAKQLGKGLRDFRKATEDLKSQFETEFYAGDVKQPPKPTLVGSPPRDAPGEAPPGVPQGGVPDQGQPGVPLATAENVPGLEAALLEPRPPAAPVQVAPAAPETPVGS